MAESNELQEVNATPVKKETSRSEIESTRGETYVTPDVDIYETDNELVLVADVPGVPTDGVDLKLEDGVLEITGHRTPGSDEEPVYQEFRPASYYRAFSVSDEIESGGIGASLSDGVLTVTLPKAPKAKPRKIEVSAG